MTTTLPGKETRPYGLWSSPVSPKMLSQGLRLDDVSWDSDGRTLVWLEGRSDRGVLTAAAVDDPAPRDLTADLSVRARVGYGGGDFTVAHGDVYFIADGRLYRQPLAGGTARAISPGFGAAAAPAVSPDGRWVLYVHTYEDVDTLALVDSEGQGWPVKAAAGRDFYMQPRWSPAGDRIAWVAWDHPSMPWDGTELWLADFSAEGGPRVSNPRKVTGGADVSIYQPEFSPEGRTIAFVSDETGWGQLYLCDLASGETRRLTEGEAEYGQPAWAQGKRSYAFIEGGRRIAAVRSERGFDRLELIETATGTVREAGPGMSAYTYIDQVTATPAGTEIAAIVSGSGRPARVVSLNAASGDVRVWARSTGETVLPGAFSQPEPFSWRSFDGEEAHGLFYPPAGERFSSPGLPPLIVLVHGGPTGQARSNFSANVQFFATRGYAVLAVNYRGSTGYGRAYMEKLRGSWGIYDVEDCVSGARALAAAGRVDPVKRVIMGGSAGGFTVLQTLVLHPGVFTAGLCLFGVSNQFTLAADTHKFEARYLDSLLGPLPEAAATYRERSPVFHADRIADPVAVFQGEIDQVVPRAQSDEIVASLKARGVPHEYHVYAGEGHGWRKAETIEAFYTAVDRFLRQYVVFA